MKRLIMCEGPNELAIVRILIAQDKLVFGEDDLIGLTPFHARQIKMIAPSFLVSPVGTRPAGWSL